MGIAVVLTTGCSYPRDTDPESGEIMIPAIDLNQPAKTETATFALG